MILLGDSPKIPQKFSQIWHTFRMELLFSLWKDRNVVLFTHYFLDVNIAMYTKACIYNNVIMQIQVQANKVALEVSHLQELLNHWGNAPCTIARVPLDALADASMSHGHHSRCQSSGCHSHIPCSRAPRHHSPSGSIDRWRCHSTSPPCGGSGQSPGPRKAYFGKFPCLALAISPPWLETKDVKTAPVPPVVTTTNDDWTIPSLPHNPTDTWGFPNKDDPPPSVGVALAA